MDELKKDIKAVKNPRLKAFAADELTLQNRHPERDPKKHNEPIEMLSTLNLPDSSDDLSEVYGHLQ